MIVSARMWFPRNRWREEKTIMKESTQDVVIVGSSISGNLIASHLKKTQPDLSVTIVGPREENLPIVGESLTEYSTHFLYQLGLGRYLEEEHLHKYGLTFHFKEDINNPEDRRYSTHESLAIPAVPSKQINRFTFDKRISELAEELGVKHLEATVTDIALGKDSPHQLTIKNGAISELSAKWLIDASGRRRLLANKLNLVQKPEFQRSAFWFRLVDFDQTFLERMESIKPPQTAFDSYYVTHHFFGKGNWLWCIPLRDPEHKNMISIGITYRPDVFPGKVKNIDSFLEYVSSEHPAVVEMIESGTVHDTNFYSKYRYDVNELYSDDRWFIVGDAGGTVDPLYSTGVVMTAIQSTQVGEIIRREREGSLKKSYTADIQNAFTTLRSSIQSEITALYEVMHDPYQSNWRMQLATVQYFYFFLPSWLNGYMVDQVGSKWVKDVIETGNDDYRSFLELIDAASKRLGKSGVEKIRYHYDKTVNWNLWGPSDELFGKYFSRLCFYLARFRFELLRDAGWKNWPMHLKVCARGVLFGLFFRFLFHKRSIKASKLIERKVVESQNNSRNAEQVMAKSLPTGKEERPLAA